MVSSSSVFSLACVRGVPVVCLLLICASVESALLLNTRLSMSVVFCSVFSSRWCSGVYLSLWVFYFSMHACIWMGGWNVLARKSWVCVAVVPAFCSVLDVHMAWCNYLGSLLQDTIRDTFLRAMQGPSHLVRYQNRPDTRGPYEGL